MVHRKVQMYVGVQWVGDTCFGDSRESSSADQSRDSCTALGEFLGSFNCRDFELTSRKVFGKLSFNILCPGQREAALVLL